MTLKHLFIIITVGHLSMVNGEVVDHRQRYSILGLGDSITEGGDSFSSYIYPLWEKLFSGGYTVDFIGPKVQQCRIGELSHAGYSGKTIEYLDSQIDSIYTVYPADIVLLHAGHNHFAEEKPVKNMIASYESVIRKIKAINPEVILLMAKVIPSGKLPKYNYIPELNEEIERMVFRMNDPDIILVDQAAAFIWKEHTIEDKVHPNRQGAVQIATTWYEALISVLPSPAQSFHPEIIPYKIIDGDTLRMHIFKPEDWKSGDNRSVLVYFFGGGWKSGTPLQFYRECAYYASKGMVAISVDYRIRFIHGSSPEDSLEDAKDAICWLRSHADTLGVDIDKIAASGASAGGYLAAAMGNFPEAERKCFRPDLLILNYAALDRLEESNVRFPPILFLVGSEDPLVTLASVNRFGEQVTKYGGQFDLYVFEGAGHPVFYYRKGLDERFYKIRTLTDSFLKRFGYIE